MILTLSELFTYLLSVVYVTGARAGKEAPGNFSWKQVKKD